MSPMHVKANNNLKLSTKILKSCTLVTCYVPSTFETFKVRTNAVMTFGELKERISSGRYKLPIKEIIITVKDVEYDETND